MRRAMQDFQKTHILVIIIATIRADRDWRLFTTYIMKAAARVTNLTYRKKLLRNIEYKYIYININLQPNKKVNVPLLSAQIVTRIQNGCTLTTRTPVKHHHHAARFRFMLKKIICIYFIYFFFFTFFFCFIYWMLL